MEDDTSQFIEVGAVYAAPGCRPALGPTSIEICAGRIVALHPLSSECVTSSSKYLVALPAFSNAHDHGRPLRSLSYDALDDTLESWLPALAREPRTDPYTLAAVAYARLAQTGVCSTNHCYSVYNNDDLYQEAEAISRAARDVGIRVAFGVPFVERNFPVYGEIQKFLALLPPEDHAGILTLSAARKARSEKAIVLFDKIASLEHDFFQVQFCPVGPQWVSNETLRMIAKRSAESGRRIHMHLLETQWQREWADAQYPQGGLLNHLDQLGLLSSRLTVAHGVQLREDECALLAERQVTVCINTSSNLRLRSGIARVSCLKQKSVPFAIGLDGLSFEDDDDMFKELRLFWHLQRGYGAECLLEEADVYKAACVTGRKTIVQDEGGQLNIGAPADLIIVDIRRIIQDRLRPSMPKDLLPLMFVRMTKGDIVKVIVAGRTIVSNGNCMTVDLPTLTERLWSEARMKVSNLDLDEIDQRVERLRAAIKKFYSCNYHQACIEKD